LEGERDGDTADAKTGEKGRNLEAEVVENDEKHDRPEDDGRRVADRCDDRGGGSVLGEPAFAIGLEPRAETGARPDADLDPDNNDDRLT